MPKQISDIQKKVLGTLSGFSAGQRVVSAIAVVGVIAGFMLFGSWASKPSMTPLFTNLEASDASAITSKLSSQHVKFALEDGGHTVMVPQKDVYQLRIDMSSAGLPAGGNQGYSILDKQGITTSEFTQRVDYQRAMEGELAKTIDAIDGVDAATVHLVIPQDDIFSADTQHPSAAVLIKTSPAKTIAPGAVQGIVHLVSSSIQGLEPNQVTVTDSKGTVLAAPGEDGASAAAGDTRAMQTNTFESALSSDIQDMLTAALGPGHAVVRVNADLDFDQKSTQTETYDATKPGAVVASSSSKEVFNGNGSGTGATGVLGQNGVTPTNGSVTNGVSGSGATSGNGNYTKEDSQQQLAQSKVLEQIKSAPGKVNRLSVAVLLDSGAQGVDKDTVTRLVTAAAGIDTNRGDSLAVDTMAFDTTAAKAAQKELNQAASAKKMGSLMSLVRTVVVLLVVGAVVLILLRRASKAMPTRTPVILPPDLADLTSSRALPAERRRASDRSDERVLAGVGARAVGAGDDSGALLPHRVDRNEVEGEITNMIERQPEEVAQLLRSWLADRRG